MLQGNKQSAQGFARMMYALSSLPQFTICCMNGSAMGGGFGLVCSCDYVIATKQAHATLSEVKLGVIPAVISPHVCRTIGTSNCKRLFCTAENANMQTAVEIGCQRDCTENSAAGALLRRFFEAVPPKLPQPAHLEWSHRIHGEGVS